MKRDGRPGNRDLRPSRDRQLEDHDEGVGDETRDVIMEHTIYLEATMRAPLDEVCDVLAKRSAHDDHPEHLQVELGSGRAVRQAVAVVSGPVEVQGGSLAQPIHIEAADHPELFPTLDGELFALAKRSTGETRICLAGRYQPPLGPAGAIGHRLGGRRLAEESIRAFFGELVHGITRELEMMQVGFKPAPTAWSLRDQD